MVERGMRHRAPFLWVLVPYSGGLVAARCFPNDTSPGLWLVLAGVFGALALLRRERVWHFVPLLITAAGLAGFGRCVDERRRSPEFDGLPARAIHADVTIERVFPKAKPGRASGIARIQKTDAPADWRGQRVAFSLRLPVGAGIRQGETWRMWGVAEFLPDDSPPDTFEGYLVSGGVNLRARRGNLVKQLAPPSRLRSWQQQAFAACEGWLAAGLSAHPTLVSVYHGLLLGEVSALTEDQKTLFAQTGTMHLFSVSGLHIGVVALVMHTVLIRLPLQVRVAVLIPLLAAYVFLTGGSPAAVRAFWMVAALEMGRALERRPNPLSALCVAALVSLVTDPLQLFSASFQYSYGIVASLILLGQPLHTAWADRWQPFERTPALLLTPLHRCCQWAARQLTSALSLGLAASLIGEVCTLHYFHLVTPGGLAANLVLIPLSSLAIVGGMISLAAGACGATFIGEFFNHASAVVIQLCLWLLDSWRATIGGYREAQFVSQQLGYVVLATCVGLLLVGYKLQWRPARWAWLAPWVVVAVTLVFGARFN
ncbi:MAG: ComEC/Rec2 family competence protein [Opitutaceae bacterium]|nr:ComEC/Rec2 family competence protein [Opitutaceae bacterium]